MQTRDVSKRRVVKVFCLTIIVWSQVPDAIKSQYQNPPPMLLPARVRQLELVCSGVPDHLPSRHFTTEAEQKEVGRQKLQKNSVFWFKNTPSFFLFMT